MRAAWLLVLPLLAGPGRLVQGPVGQAPDSTDVLAEARDVQRAFESRRRHLLPVTYGSYGRCDERIGRFCYWYGESDTLLPPEPARVHEERARFLDSLATLHELVPGDEWLLSQRVRYLVEHGDTAAAVRLTDACAAGRWLCSALRGYALHGALRFAEADSAYQTALREMDTDTRCEWTDWTRVVDGRLHGRLRELGCEAWGALVDSVLWMGDPLLSEPGNDLRTELYSRRVIDWLLRTSRSPQAMSWGRDVTELFTRYGWPVRWSVAERRHATLEPASVVGHDPSPAFAFLPMVEDDSAESWRFDLKRDRPRARYAPAYSRAFTALEAYQLARFPTGDSTRLVAAFAVAGDSLLDTPGSEAMLAASPAPDAPTILTRGPLGDDARATLSVQVGAGPVMIGLEAVAPERRRIARARLMLSDVARNDDLVMSDLLLFRVGELLPGSLDDALARALPAPKWRRADPVGVYWEVTSGPRDSVAVSIAVVPERRGLLGRIGQSLSLVGRRAPLTLQWTVPELRGSVVTGRAFELDLERLDAGKYELQVTLTAADGTERTVSRPIEILK